MSLVCCTSKSRMFAPMAWTVPASRNTQSPGFGVKLCSVSRRGLRRQRRAEVGRRSRRRRTRRRCGSSPGRRRGPPTPPSCRACPGRSRAACSSFGWTWTDSSCRASMNFSSSGNRPCAGAASAEDRGAGRRRAVRGACVPASGPSATRLGLPSTSLSTHASPIGSSCGGRAVQERGQPAAAPEHALEDRLERQRVERVRHQDFPGIREPTPSAASL